MPGKTAVAHYLLDERMRHVQYHTECAYAYITLLSPVLRLPAEYWELYGALTRGMGNLDLGAG